MFKIQKINNMPLPSLSPFLAFDQFTIYIFINELKNTFFSIIFAWPIYGFLKPFDFLETDKREECGMRGRGGEEEKKHGEGIYHVFKL